MLDSSLLLWILPSLLGVIVDMLPLIIIGIIIELVICFNKISYAYFVPVLGVIYALIRTVEYYNYSLSLSQLNNNYLTYGIFLFLTYLSISIMTFLVQLIFKKVKRRKLNYEKAKEF